MGPVSTVSHSSAIPVFQRYPELYLKPRSSRAALLPPSAVLPVRAWKWTTGNPFDRIPTLPSPVPHLHGWLNEQVLL